VLFRSIECSRVFHEGNTLFFKAETSLRCMKWLQQLSTTKTTSALIRRQNRSQGNG